MRCWSAEDSFAFVDQPQTNGVYERFCLTVNQQTVYGRLISRVAKL